MIVEVALSEADAERVADFVKDCREKDAVLVAVFVRDRREAEVDIVFV